MAKTSQRRFVRYEKDQAGCMWAFISIFDRHGRNTQQLLSDRKRQSRQDGGTRCSTSKRHVLKISDRSSQDIHGGEERNNLLDDEPRSLVKKKHKRRSKMSKSCSDIHFELDAATNLGTEEFCFKNLDAQALIKELYLQIHMKNASCMKHERINDIDIDEKFVEAVKTFVNRRFADGKHLPEDWETNHSKEFLDGLETTRMR